MSPVARFRPFGRREDRGAAHEPDPWLDDPPSRGRPDRARDVPDRAGRDRLTDGWDADVFDPPAPATRAATPAMWAPRPVEPAGDSDRAPVTDPFGFPPVPPVVGGRDDVPVRRDEVPAWAAWVPEQTPRPDRAERTPAVRAPGVRSPWAVDDEPIAPAGPAGPVAPVGPVAPAATSAPVAGATPGGAIPAAPVAPTTPATRPAPAAPDSAPPDRGVDAGQDTAPPRDPAVPRNAVAFPDPAASRDAVTPRRAVAGPDAASPPDLPDLPDEPPPDPAEAAALAGAFAADYLSWDEDDPARRGRALSDHLPGPAADHALLGWSGAGRQRAEFVLPGAVRPDGDGRLVVDVRVRVVPYRRVSRSEATPEPDPGDALGTPSAAPSVTARGWRGLAARWVRLGVSVVRDGDRLVVDAGEEAFDGPVVGQPPVETAVRAVRAIRAASSAPPVEDPTLDGDDVVSPNGSRR